MSRESTVHGGPSFLEHALTSAPEQTGPSTMSGSNRAPAAGRGTVRVAATDVWRRWDWARPVRPAVRELRQAAPTDGDGPPVLFVPDLRDPGGAAALEPWLAAAAEQGHRAYAVSPRGCGGTTGPGRRFAVSRREWVHDVVQAAAGLPQRAVLVGHGTGGWVVAHALHRYPALAAVLVEPVGLPGRRLPGPGVLLRRPALGLAMLLGRDPRVPQVAPPVLVAAGDRYPHKVLSDLAVRYGARSVRLPVSGSGALPGIGPVLGWLAERP